MATQQDKLFLLEVSDGGHVFSVNPDGTDKRILVTGSRNPDGIAVDVEGGSVYWTEMGFPPVNDGSIERADLDGSNRVSVVPRGGTYTPKQLQLEPASRKLYWSDREGMRVMRCDLDGSHVEVLVQTGEGDEDRIVWASPSTRRAGTSTGRRRARRTQARAGSCGPGSICPAAKPPTEGLTSRCCSTASPSRST